MNFHNSGQAGSAAPGFFPLLLQVRFSPGRVPGVFLSAFPWPDPVPVRRQPAAFFLPAFPGVSASVPGPVPYRHLHTLPGNVSRFCEFHDAVLRSQTPACGASGYRNQSHGCVPAGYVHTVLRTQMPRSVLLIFYFHTVMLRHSPNSSSSVFFHLRNQFILVFYQFF